MIANEYHIGRKAGASILHSVRSAAALGRPLNTFVTINFWQLGSTADTIFRDFADLRESGFSGGQRISHAASYSPGMARRHTHMCTRLLVTSRTLIGWFTSTLRT